MDRVPAAILAGGRSRRMGTDKALLAWGGGTLIGAVRDRLAELLAGLGVPLVGFYYCPHHPEGTVPRYAVPCGCRKPEPGLILKAAREHGVALEDSWFIGDILDDLPGQMDTVQAATSAASEAIRQRYFPTSAAPTWVGERS